LANILTWALGRALSDRFYWSQFLAWIPTALSCAASAALVALSVVLRLLVARPNPRSRPSQLFRAGLLLAISQLLWFGIIECRCYRLIGREPISVAAARPGGLRILYWNASSVSGADLRTSMNLVPSDLAITANPTWERPFTEMAQAFGPSWYLNAGCFVVLSRNPILRWGATELGLSGQKQVAIGEGEFDIRPRGSIDTGEAVWLELDTRPTLGRTTVLWLLDLPSDERVGRWRNASIAAAAMRNWPGPAILSNGSGIRTGSVPMTGFPSPDIVLGDLNTPRGSASLSLLAPGLRDVYEQGGAGYAVTFPRRQAITHIDLTLAAPWLKGSDYRIIDPGRGKHRMQWSRLEAR
jgi:hypothetical protein